jgi:hypothetical protein
LYVGGRCSGNSSSRTVQRATIVDSELLPPQGILLILTDGSTDPSHTCDVVVVVVHQFQQVRHAAEPAGPATNQGTVSRNNNNYYYNNSTRNATAATCKTPSETSTTTTTTTSSSIGPSLFGFGTTRFCEGGV